MPCMCLQSGTLCIQLTKFHNTANVSSYVWYADKGSGEISKCLLSSVVICKCFIPLSVHCFEQHLFSPLKYVLTVDLTEVVSSRTHKLPNFSETLQILSLMQHPVEQGGERVSLAFHCYEDIFVQCAFWFRNPSCCSQNLLDASMSF